MPELPEVETIRRLLCCGDFEKPSLIGKLIKSGTVLWPRSLAVPDAELFDAQIAGQTIIEIGRRGKYLIMKLDQDCLLVHLRMSGDLFVEPQSSPIQKHHRLLLNFHDSWRLTFNDPRKFGRVWLVADPDSIVGNLGPEPMEEGFTAGRLHQMLMKHHRQLKPLLMDQHFLAGMGNIYTDEALNLARLHPLRIADDISPGEATNLWRAIREVLGEGIRRNGSSIDWVYRGGEFQNYFRVYGRSNEPCMDCGALVQRIVVGQRSTYYCPNCQVI